jgi:hypothetical protein
MERDLHQIGNCEVELGVSVGTVEGRDEDAVMGQCEGRRRSRQPVRSCRYLRCKVLMAATSVWGRHGKRWQQKVNALSLDSVHSLLLELKNTSG